MVIAIPRNSSPIFSAIGSVIKAVTTPISNIFQRVFPAVRPLTKDAIWERVVVKKLNEDGSFYKYIDEDGEITSQDALFEYIVHYPTGNLYADESQAVVGFKCMMIVFANPVFAAVKMFWHAGRLLVDTALIATNSLKEFIRLRSQSNSDAALADLKKATLETITSSVKENVWRVVSAPLFALGVEIGAFIGLISPYHGRAFIAQVEKASQGGRGLKEYYCFLDKCLGGEILSFKDCVEALSKKEVCFLAMCFQSLGSLNHRFHIEKRMPIKTF